MTVTCPQPEQAEIAARANELVRTLAITRRERTAEAARLEALAMVSAGLSHLQAVLDPAETKQLLLDVIAPVQQRAGTLRTRGPPS